MTEQTTIQIDEDVWQELNQKKEMGESFNEVLRRLLKMKEVKK